MAIAWLTHLRISIPSSGAPPGCVPADCYTGGAPRKNWLSSQRVSFADDVTVLGDVSPSGCSPLLEKLTPIVSAFVVDDVVVPEGETNGSSDVDPDVIPHPPGFPPFSWSIVVGHVAIEQSCFPFGDGGSPDFLTSQPDVEPPFSPITQAHDSESVGSPDVGLLVSALVDVGTDTAADVSRPVSPLPSVESLFLQDMLWAPVARWRLAREGPFLAERSPESIRSLGVGCAFRNTSYRSSDYDAPSGEFGLPVHHLRFLEWIGVPQSACLLEMGAGRWVDHLSRDQAIAAAVHLQGDMGLMQTNLDVLDQYTLSLQGMASKLIKLCLGV